jgi:hypothetical protein
MDKLKLTRRNFLGASGLLGISLFGLGGLFESDKFSQLKQYIDDLFVDLADSFNSLIRRVDMIEEHVTTNDYTAVVSKKGREHLLKMDEGVKHFADAGAIQKAIDEVSR